MPLEADEFVKVPLDPQELASTVEALHDAILRRLSWSVYEEHEAWRNLPLENVQVILDSMVSAYGKGMMAFGEGAFKKSQDYGDHFSMPEVIWDMLAKLSYAETWDDVPFHTKHDPDECEACKKINR